MAFPDKTVERLRRYLAFGALLNKTDKLSLYLEATVKAFIISNPHLYGGIKGLLERKLWYNREDILVLFGRLNELLKLNIELKAENLPGERAKLIAEIKTLTASIKGE